METIKRSKIDMCFSVKGSIIPVDHGFYVYSALSRMMPQIHQRNDIVIKPIRGRYKGNGVLDISPCSELVLRLNTNQIQEYLFLANTRIKVNGYKIVIGSLCFKSINPHPNLYAHTVTTKNGQNQQRFETEITKQLRKISFNARIKILKRKTLKIHNQQVVGYSLSVHDLTRQESIFLQEKGLGGRRKMGCGFFEHGKQNK